MNKSSQFLALAVLMAVVDLAVFIYCIPIICQAWGFNTWFMCTLFVGLFVWTRSLASLWRIAIYHLLRQRTLPTPSFPQPPLLVVSSEKEETHV